MKAVYGSTVLAEAPSEELVKIEGNWYFPPSSLAGDEFATSDTAYQLADGRWIGKARVDVLVPASPLVVLG